MRALSVDDIVIIPPSEIAELPPPRPLVLLGCRVLNFECGLIITGTGFKLIVGKWKLTLGRFS